MWNEVQPGGQRMIEFKKILDTEEYPWCNEAALVRVTGGKKALTSVYSECTDDYTHKSLLLLNGKPIVQREYPECSTCCALLARGYGIEKTDCAELQTIRDRINSGYVDLRTSVHNIEPILGLLDDGYYVVADVPMYPTDGSGRFFANVPDKLTDIKAATADYYNCDFLDTADTFPAYLYPTQSNSMLDRKRAEYYLDKIDKPDAPRAIAYYDYGYVCALLDGHHKAYAAAMKGCQLYTTVIIPVSCGYIDYKTKLEYVCFSAIMIPVSEFQVYDRNETYIKQDIEFAEYHNDPVPENEFDFTLYPTSDELSGIYVAHAEKLEITEQLVKQWLSSDDYTDRLRLECVLLYYAKRKPEEAYMIAKVVVAEVPETAPFDKLITLSYRVIANNKCEESEQIMLEYIINHDNTSAAWKICNSYWE